MADDDETAVYLLQIGDGIIDPERFNRAHEELKRAFENSDVDGEFVLLNAAAQSIDKSELIDALTE
jgi:hypothetical protein